MTPDQTALALATGSGVIASILTELVNRLTPNTKIPPLILKALALTLAAVAVVGLAYLQGNGNVADWGTVGGQVLVAWLSALGVHDVASPRKDTPTP
jgi:lysozyme family protein